MEETVERYIVTHHQTDEWYNVWDKLLSLDVVKVSGLTGRGKEIADRACADLNAHPFPPMEEVI
jgi:hypothetical protein